jgi:uncharacterized protein YyaL (SSP411 family)
VEDIAEYLVHDALAHPHGGFYSAEDADSLPTANSQEKKGYLNLTRVNSRGCILCVDELLKENADIAATYWNVKEDGNVDPRHDIQGELEEQVTP